MIPLRERMGITLLVAYASTALSQLATQLYFFLILKYLPIEAVGVYCWAVAVATIYSYVLDLGLATFLVGELSNSKYGLKQLIQLILMTRAPLVVVGCALLEIWARATNASSTEYWTLALVTTAYVIQLVDVGLGPWFQVHQRQSKINAVGLALPIARLVALSLPLLLGYRLDLKLIVGIIIVTQVLNTIGIIGLAVYEQRSIKLTASDVPSETIGRLWRRFWERGPRLALMYVFVALQARLDWLLVSGMLSKAALANYSLANKIIEALMLFSAVWARTSFPWLSRVDADEAVLQTRLALLRRLFVVCSALLTAGTVFWVLPFAHLLFRNKFAGAEDAIKIMTPAGAIFMLNQYLFYLVLTRKVETQYTVVLIFTTASQAMTDVWLLPHLGIAGAAVGMLVLGFTLHIGQMVLLCRCNAISVRDVWRQESFLLGSLGIILCLWFIKTGPLIGSLLSLCAVGGLGGLLVLRRVDRTHLRAWISNALGRTASVPGVI
jgi:O-antigen/teichoic acid export membrane protein